MTDTEIIEWIERHPECRKDIDVAMDNTWTWYSVKGKPNHKGWTRAKSFRECIEKLKEQHGK